ncbi:putative uncharacterized protein [Rhodococcus sp. AW25M09]|uniref:DUF4192 domain-containing protein n=1 Tax=Rhodococcus sp. AW25M09 TaxID=1268303 RepID=UPI0002ABA71B|nr:DUF4192 domain-containing protein [Rhodococcus sp. AW25M09]CCQ16707.1 putative uncharacterized protein [Rhodococcus sp. AW25M09]
MYIPTNSYGNFDSRHRVRLGDASELMAAVPALLGFHPHRSMVLIAVKDDGASVGPTMRHDLVLAGERIDRRAGSGTRATPEMLDVIGYLAGYCASENIPVVMAVFVDDRLDRAVRSPHLLDVEALVRELVTSLATFGVQLSCALAASEIADAAGWWSLCGPQLHGLMSDPASSPLTVARVLDGYSVRRSRTELAETIAPGPENTVRAVAAEIARGGRAGRRSRADELRSVLSYVARAPYDTELEPVDIARVAVSIGDVQVRDALLALTLGDDAGFVEEFWVMICRVLPERERAIAATLLAFSAYVRGDGPMARIAIDAALEADETYSLARLLDRSLSAGAGPELVREVAESGFACARECGVRLPGDPFGRR